MAEAPLPFFSRILLAYVCFFRVLFDGLFAARVQLLRARPEAFDEIPETVRVPETPSAPPPKEKEPAAKQKPVAPAPPSEEELRRLRQQGALQLLALLQDGGRLVDFLQQDVESFPDEEIGAAARVVHAGCRKTLRAHVTVGPVDEREEGARCVLEAGYDVSSYKLTGDVAGSAPFRGVLRHRGWRAQKIELPTLIGDHDVHVVARAEVEL